MCVEVVHHQHHFLGIRILIVQNPFYALSPLVDVQTVINLISSTTTKRGLSVVCERDDTVYPLAQKVSDKEFKSINIRKIEPFGEWNYIILPNK